MHGSLSAVMAGVADSDLIRQTRNDAVTALNDATARLSRADQREAELERREGELAARKALLADTALKVADFAGRACALYEEYKQRRADQERFAEPLSAPPCDITSGDPSGSHDTAAPVGEPEPREAELTPSDDILPPAVTPPKEELEDREEQDDPELSDASSRVGDEELPEPLAAYEPEDPPEPRGSVFPQPTAISLNSK
jgi:hypothetical protein